MTATRTGLWGVLLLVQGCLAPKYENVEVRPDSAGGKASSKTGGRSGSNLGGEAGVVINAGGTGTAQGSGTSVGGSNFAVAGSNGGGQPTGGLPSGAGSNSFGGATAAGGANASLGGATAAGGVPGTDGGTTSAGGSTSGGASLGGSTATSGGASLGGSTATSGGVGFGGSSSTLGGATGGIPTLGGASTGGRPVSTGGSIATGGKPDTGGATATGGTTTTATGGTTTTATGGTMATATGGTTATATGGTTATATGGSPGITPADIVPNLAAGFYWEATCQGSITVTGHNCPLYDSGCPSGGINRDTVLNVMGTPGQTYSVTIEARGVIGTRCYKNGTRASTATPSDAGTNNWWYTGGVYDNPTGWWNSYELHVAPTTGDASGDVYYFNGSDVGGGAWCEKEATYLVKYNASFKVKGGGTMTFRFHDQNCKAQQNCGSNIDPNSSCLPRTVDLTGMSVQPPATFAQPPTNNLSTTYYPQWMWLVATSVTSP